MKTEAELIGDGFTQSGAKRFLATINDYSTDLYGKSVVYGNGDKAADAGLEVTHDHVRSAAYQLSSTFAREQPSKYIIPVQIGEYMFTALAGVSGGHLKESWGVPVFAVSVALAVILFVVRNTSLKSKS